MNEVRAVNRAGSQQVRRVGIGELAVSNSEDEVLSTVALGSCVAVCLWEPIARIGGLLHFMLPDSRLNRDRARAQPAAFADTGIPMLFRAAYELGAQKRRCIVRLIGGAELSQPCDPSVGDLLNVGPRNVLAARGVLWRNGVMTSTEDVGGRVVRTITMSVADGRVTVKRDGMHAAAL